MRRALRFMVGSALLLFVFLAGNIIAFGLLQEHGIGDGGDLQPYDFADGPGLIADSKRQEIAITTTTLEIVPLVDDTASHATPTTTTLRPSIQTTTTMPVTVRNAQSVPVRNVPAPRPVRRTRAS